MRNDGRLRDLFAGPIVAQMARLLTQVDRNPHSPTYGSCCRNFWHYRIEDISNAQMQEMVLTLALVYSYESPQNPYRGSEKLLRWIEAILRYTCTLQRRSGSFDEVYRGQDSYAATAFVGFCVSETVLQLREVLPKRDAQACIEVLRRAAGWLGRTREEFAANQMAGAAAFLFNLARLTGETRVERQGRDLVDLIGAMQSDEGWFPEYGGADIGYGSLTMSYLALIDARVPGTPAGEIALRSASFLRNFVHPDGSVGGEYGSRNTEYFIPLGPILMHAGSQDMAELRAFLTSMLAAGKHEIITRGLDDRYFAYLSPFYMLAAQSCGEETIGGIEDGARVFSAPRNRYFEQCGMLSVTTDRFHFVANMRKGGVIRVDYFDGRTVLDDGVFGVTISGAAFTTQYLDNRAQVTVDTHGARVKGSIFVCKPVQISPFKNVLVRTFNLIVPARMRRLFLDFLRKRAVSSGARIGTFERTIEIGDDRIEVSDTLVFDVRIREAALVLDKERAFSFASTGFFQPYEIGISPGRHIPIEAGSPAPVTVRRTITIDGVRFRDGE